VTTREEDLDRIRRALHEAGALLRGYSPAGVEIRRKAHGSPVTDADLAADDLLRRTLPRPGEGWLSEESPDDVARLDHERLWIVDPLDGTREFLAGVPEWCVSIGLVEHGVAVAGGVYNPTTGELFLGAVGAGATLNGQPIAASRRQVLAGALVLVSRWAQARRRRPVPEGMDVQLRPVGSMAYTLALVAAGRADATWSRSVKAEWDIAAGAALITAAGGRVSAWSGAPLAFNQWPPRTQGIVASGPDLHEAIRALIAAVPEER
jgi:myo-inositol-1(or 4)-monophosphatase